MFVPSLYYAKEVNTWILENWKTLIDHLKTYIPTTLNILPYNGKHRNRVEVQYIAVIWI